MSLGKDYTLANTELASGAADTLDPITRFLFQRYHETQPLFNESRPPNVL